MKQSIQQNLLRTWKNKVFALMILAMNLCMVLMTHDITFLVMILPAIVALFFAKRDYVDAEEWYRDK